MKSLSRLLAIVKKEVRQLRRDRLTFGMVVGLPILQMLLFGYAINTDVRNLRTAIANQANTHLSREFVAQLVLIRLGFVIGVDVGLEEIHEYVEYVFFHAWSGSLSCPVPESVCQ